MGERMVTMKPTYPIFILIGDEKSVELIQKPKELCHYEKYDIEEGLYEGWDANGYPLRVKWDSKHRCTSVEIYKEVNEKENLIKAMLNYAYHYRPEAQFNYTGESDNMVTLLRAVEKYVNEKQSNNITLKVISCIRKLFRAR
jgi:hypothetical protein